MRYTLYKIITNAFITYQLDTSSNVQVRPSINLMTAIDRGCMMGSYTYARCMNTKAKHIDFIPILPTLYPQLFMTK